MKTFDFDMTNPATGEPFRWDDPNVIWGEQGCYLEPGDPGYVPCHGQGAEAAPGAARRDPMLLLELAKDTPPGGGKPLTLSKYRYHVVPGSRGGFSAQPVLAAECDGETIDAAVSAATGLPEEKCAEVLAAYMDQLFMSAAGSRWAHAMHNLLSTLPCSDGMREVPDDFCAAA